jgi:hypothetical protein
MPVKEFSVIFSQFFVIFWGKMRFEYNFHVDVPLINTETADGISWNLVGHKHCIDLWSENAAQNINVCCI